MCTSTIAYDRKSREYVVTSPEGAVIGSFPSGEDGRQAAQQAAVQHDDPAVHAAALYLAEVLLGYLPRLKSRVWKAAALVVSGQVYEPFGGLESAVTVARVRSQRSSGGDERFYPVELDSERYSCECPDFLGDHAIRASSGQRLCKHILAAQICSILDRPLAPAPARQPVYRRPRHPQPAPLAQAEPPARPRQMTDLEIDELNELLFGF